MTAVSDPRPRRSPRRGHHVRRRGGRGPSGERRRPGRRRRARPDGRPCRPAPFPTPFPPIPLPILRKRLVYGRYRSGGSGFQLELRVDVGGTRPMNRVSGDFFYVCRWQHSRTSVRSASTPRRSPRPPPRCGSRDRDLHLGRRRAARARDDPAGDDLRGRRRRRRSSSSLRRARRAPRTRARSRRPTSAACCGSRTASPARCPFVSYDTDPARRRRPGSHSGVLDVSGAYRLAGIEVLPSGTPNVIPVAAAGADAKWTDAELHAAMVANFSLWANVPQWKVWLLVATEHVGGYRGIMFDYTDTHQRQGCAVFYNAIAGSAPARPARAAAHLRARARARVQPAALVAEEPRGPAAAARPQQRARRPVVDELHLELPAVVRARRRRRRTGRRSRSSSPTTRWSTCATASTATSSWARTRSARAPRRSIRTCSRRPSRTAPGSPWRSAPRGVRATASRSSWS